MSNLSQILPEWYEAKKKIEKYEKKIEKYKSLVEKELNSQNTDSVVAGGYKVTRNRVTRGTISKGNIPEDLWYKYSKKSNFSTLTLKKI